MRKPYVVRTTEESVFGLFCSSFKFYLSCFGGTKVSWSSWSILNTRVTISSFEHNGVRVSWIKPWVVLVEVKKKRRCLAKEACYC